MKTRDSVSGLSPSSYSPPPDTARRPRNALVYGFTHELIDLRYDHREKAGLPTIRRDTYFARLFFLSDFAVS